MSTAPVTLDSIRAAAEAKYGSYEIDLGDDGVVTLLNPLRLSSGQREALSGAQESLGAKDADQVEVLKNILVSIAATPSQGEKLLQAVDGDLALMAAILESYGEKVQVGEASASQD